MKLQGSMALSSSGTAGRSKGAAQSQASGNESSQGVALRILAGLVVVDTSPHTNSGRRLRDGAPQMQSVAPQRAVQVCSGNIRENVRARYAFAPWPAHSPGCSRSI